MIYVHLIKIQHTLTWCNICPSVYKSDIPPAGSQGVMCMWCMCTCVCVCVYVHVRVCMCIFYVYVHVYKPPLQQVVYHLCIIYTSRPWFIYLRGTELTAASFSELLGSRCSAMTFSISCNTACFSMESSTFLPMSFSGLRYCWCVCVGVCVCMCVCMCYVSVCMGM